MNAIRDRLLHGGIWAITGRASGIVLGLGTNVLLARSLPPSELGAYFIAATLVSFLSIVGMLGINQSVIRFVGERVALGQRERLRTVLRIVFLAGGAGSLAIATLYATTGSWISTHLLGSDVLAAGTLLVALWLGLTVLQQLHVAALRAFHDLRAVALFDSNTGLLTKGVFLLALITFWATDAGRLGNVFVAHIASLALGLYFAAAALRRKTPSTRPNTLYAFRGEGQSLLRRMIKASLPLLGTGVMFSLLASAGVWILAGFRTEQEVALYSASFRLGALVTFFATAAAQFLPPMIAELYARGERKQLQDLLQVVAAWTILPTLLVAGMFISFGAPILGLIYGDFYREGASILSILCIGWVLAVWTGQCQEMLMMTGHEKLLMLQVIASTAVGLALAFLLVQPYGAEGVAFSWVAAIGLQNAAAVLLARHKTGVWVHAGNIVGKLGGVRLSLLIGNKEPL